MPEKAIISEMKMRNLKQTCLCNPESLELMVLAPKSWDHKRICHHTQLKIHFYKGNIM